MSLSLHPARAKKTHHNSSEKLARRRLFAGMEPLEDRRLMAISTMYSAGVLTFTGDFGGVSNDTVIIQSTNVAGTIDYDASSAVCSGSRWPSASLQT